MNWNFKNHVSIRGRGVYVCKSGDDCGVLHSVYVMLIISYMRGTARSGMNELRFSNIKGIQDGSDIFNKDIV